jgi:hypothetical protein
MKIYVPIGDAEIVGGIKLKELERSNQQFFDVLITRYVSFTLPVSEEKKSSHIRINLYSDRGLTNLIKTINTSDNSEDREKVFGIDGSGFFEIPETGFSSTYQGKPVFVDLQEYYHLTNFVSWQIKRDSWGDKFYSVFPSTNIDNYGNGMAISGGGGGNYEYDGYFAVKDVSTSSKDIVNILNGVVFLNRKRIEIKTTEFELVDFLTGYLIDIGEYNNVCQLIDNSDFNNTEIIQGELTDEKLDPSYVFGESDVKYPCELRLVISNYNNEIKTYYTTNRDNRTDNSTDALIATIDKNDDGSLNIKQQQFGEIEKVL